MTHDDPRQLRQELLLHALRGVTDSPSLTYSIFQEHAVSIVESRLTPGHEVNSADLARRFHTSRTPVREALLLLEREDLAVVPPRRRPYVSPVALSHVREIYKIRESLYSLISELAVARASDQEIAKLATWQDLLESDAQASKVDAYFWHNVGFRNYETNLSHNTELQHRLSTLGLIG